MTVNVDATANIDRRRDKARIAAVFAITLVVLVEYLSGVHFPDWILPLVLVWVCGVEMRVWHGEYAYQILTRARRELGRAAASEMIHRHSWDNCAGDRVCCSRTREDTLNTVRDLLDPDWRKCREQAEAIHRRSRGA